MSTAVQVLAPGTFGGVTVTISPFVPIAVEATLGGAFNLGDGAFTSTTTSKSASLPIQIKFSQPVLQMSITCHGPNFAGNLLRTFDKNGRLLQEQEFPFQNNLLVNQFESTLTAIFSPTDADLAQGISGIASAVLIPAPNDWVIYKGFYIIPNDTTRTNSTFIPDRTLAYPLNIRTTALPASKFLTYIVTENVLPAIPHFNPEPQETTIILTVHPIVIPYESIVTELAQGIIQPKILNFFDDDRVLKTVLNFGDDSQVVITNWMRDPNDPSLDRFMVKLYKPLPLNIDLKDLLWISRELSPTLLDQISVIITPTGQVVLFLRPPNRGINVGGLFGVEVNNVTMRQLLPSGSIITTRSGSTLQDPILEEFFTTDLAGVELNVDYTDYNNFVHFSSAQNRLVAFRQKLIMLEGLQATIVQQVSRSYAIVSSSTLGSPTAGDISGTTNYPYIQGLLQQRQDVLRSFDGYEQFLYYQTGSFTGSLTGESEDPGVTASVSWPKDATGSVLAVSTSLALAFFDTQSAYALEYDQLNNERLANNIPAFVQDDEKSEAFFLFLDMIGHHFDIVKLYIDHLTRLYDRSPDPDKGMSKELLWHIASSLGIELPNQYAIKSLYDFTISGSATQTTYRDAVAETWKRFLHNQIFIAKSKGTKTSLQALLNAYGVLPEILRIRESVTPSPIQESGSFEEYTELIHVLDMVSGSYLTVPFSSSLLDPSTIELRFAATNFVSGTLLVGAGSTLWSLVLVPTGSTEKGYLQLKDSGGTQLVKTTIGNFYSGDYYTVMLRRNTTSSFDMTVKRFDQGVFEYNYGPTAITSGTFTGSWSAVKNILIGSSPSGGLSLSWSVDEFRVWTEVISNSTFDNHVRFPGMYAGNTSESARDALMWRFSMVIPRNLGATGSLSNDSPFIDFHTGSVAITSASATGFPSLTVFPFNFEQVSRPATRFALNSGGSQFATDLIRIAPSASFDSSSLMFPTGSAPIPVLHRDKSIRSFITRQEDRSPAPRIGFYVTLAESINDSILRSIGELDLNDLIGDPANLYRNQYPDLIDLYNFYRLNYSPTFDYNKFISFVEGLLDGVFAQAKSLMPARANTLTGIVIEPTILERNRVVMNRPLNVDGLNTRTEKNAYAIMRASGSFPDARTMDFHVEQTMSGRPLTADVSQILADITDVGDNENLLVEVDQIDARFIQSSSLILSGDDLSYETLIDLSDFQQVLAYTTPLDALVAVLPDSGTISADYATYDAIYDIADLIFTRVTAEFDMDFLAPMVNPSNDLTSPAGSEFFTHPSGSFGVLKFVRIPKNSGSLRDRGTWVPGTVYRPNDVVLQVGQSASFAAAAAGDDVQYRCLTEFVLNTNGVRVPFVSQLPPSLDRTNWVQLATEPVATLEVRKAIVSGSTVAIVPFTTAGTIFTGYAPTHYRFFRDRSLRHRRPRYIGCLQTEDTTPDGKSPFEVVPSADAQLFVTQGKPIQPPTDEGGPLLTVR